MPSVCCFVGRGPLYKFSTRRSVDRGPVPPVCCFMCRVPRTLGWMRAVLCAVCRGPTYQFSTQRSVVRGSNFRSADLCRVSFRGPRVAPGPPFSSSFVATAGALDRGHRGVQLGSGLRRRQSPSVRRTESRRRPEHARPRTLLLTSAAARVFLQLLSWLSNATPLSIIYISTVFPPL